MRSKILIVEDSNVQAKIMSQHIGDVMPYQIVTAATLAQAEETMAAEADEIFVAVLDLNLPDDQDRRIVELGLEHKVPSVVMTSSFNEELRDELLGNNVVDYFIKSNQGMDELVECIERLHKNLGTTVLVVDDTKLARRRLTQLLGNQNYQCLEAENGVQALEVMAEHPEVSMVITDYHMPEMDGFTLVSELRKKHPRDKLAVIAVSGEGGAMTAKFIKHGANDFVTKPVEAEEFYCRINQHMEFLETLRKYKAACA